MQAPVMVLNTQAKRETGAKAQISNIAAAKAVAEIIRTTLGPKSMLKMLLDPMGGIVMTNDGNSILREVDVSHPAAKSMIELSRTQDEEVGDGTTSVIVLAGEMMSVAEPFLEKQMHPTVICKAYASALADGLKILDDMCFELNVDDRLSLMNIVQSCIGTKLAAGFGQLVCELALDAVLTVKRTDSSGRTEIDIKRYAKVEKIPGAELGDSCVMQGVMFNKDITHPKMRRMIKNPRVVLLDCPLEYKKGESATNVELTKESDWEALMKQEEDAIRKMCDDILAVKPDIVITEKGVADLTQHFLLKQGVTVFRRLRKTDNNRVARATGATVLHRTHELREEHVGTACHHFEVRKIGDEYFTFFEECDNPKACTILLRGASKDFLNEVERNLLDAMNVARNVVMDPRVLPGGGASEMAVSQGLLEKSKTLEGVQVWPYKAVAVAMEVIPRTLAQNCGGDVVRLMTELRSKHASGDGKSDKNPTLGINGNTGKIEDMNSIGVWEPYKVKSQTMKTAIDSATMLLRIDDIVSGISKKEKPRASAAPPPPDGEEGGPQ